MSFLAPIAGLVAGAIGSSLVLLFWMLKLRRRPIGVSSTLLWQKSVRDVEGNIPWQRVRPSFLLFLQLLAVVLLSIAIARPVRNGGVTFGSEVVVAIDAGASMNAIADLDEHTRLDLAKRDAKTLVRQIGTRSASTKFRVVRVGMVPQMLTGASTSWRQAIAAIDQIESSDAPSDLRAAMELVESIRVGDNAEDESSGHSIQTYVFTDSDQDALSGETVVFPSASEGDARGNLGIVLASGQRDQSDPDRCRVFVTFAGRVNAKTGVVIHARVGESIVASKPISLEPDEEGIAEAAGTLIFDLDTDALVEVFFERGDVFGADDRVWVSMPDPSPIVTTIVAPDGQADPLLVDVLSAVTGGVVGEAGDGEAVLSGTGLMVYDRVNRDPRVQLPTIEFVRGSDEDSAIQRVLTWERSHPTLRDVDLGGLRFVRGGVIDGQPFATTTSGPVIAEVADEGVRHLAIGFALEDSNWGVDVSMPMFFANTIAYLLPGTSGAGKVFRTGESIGESGVVFEQVGETELDGEPIGVSILNRSQTMRAAQELNTDNASDAMSLLGSTTRAGRVEIWRWFVLAALGVLILEWLLDLARRGIV